MVELQVSQRRAAFAAAVSKAMIGARELVETHEEQQRLAQSRARRRDLDRPRLHVHKGGAGLFSRLPLGDPRNLLPAGGRLSQDDWHVWAIEREASAESLTGSFVGSFDTWEEALRTAQQLTRFGCAVAGAMQALNDVDDDAADYVSWGEVPC